MSKLDKLADLGQAVWMDYIRRSFITSGELKKWIDQGLRGMTSNPSIFQKAIAESDDYSEDLERMVTGGATTMEIYEGLVIADIQHAADAFRPVFEATSGQDGYVSLEVSPLLAYESEVTLEEVRRLWKLVDRPNVMIKIPATHAGLAPIAAATAEGINVNVTLIFSLERYAEVISAYLEGLELRAQNNQPLNGIHSVASFFVSRVDSKVDKRLEATIRQGGSQAKKAKSLLGQAAVANAKVAYEQFEAAFLENGRFAPLKAKGANLQRPLWASTSTKNPEYSEILYVQTLIGPHTVNTLPEQTLEAFLDHGIVKETIHEEVDKAHKVLQELGELGISMTAVTQELEEEGVKAFADSFDSLLRTIEDRQAGLQRNWHALPNNLGSFRNLDDPRPDLVTWQSQQILPRLWKKDYTLWGDSPDEITNRMDWLDIADTIDLQPVEDLVEAVTESGYTQSVLLGMGGSSLAPDLFAKTFGHDHHGLDLKVLDTTDPDAIYTLTASIDPNRTLFIVSTKSGTTEETLSLFKYFYNWTVDTLGPAGARAHFVAITDPSSKLEKLAQELGFRYTFLNNPNIGGRYSALSYFGLVPAGLVGVDLKRLLANTRRVKGLTGPDVPAAANPAAVLGQLIGEAARTGKNKLTFILSESIQSFGDWVEQLLAESTGKEGKGILPVVGESLGVPAVYGRDRLFVQIKIEGDRSQDFTLKQLEDSGFPVISLSLRDRYDLGGQFLLWELVTAIAGWRLAIQPFDQPNVESAKVRAREMVAAYKSSGSLPGEPPVISKDGISVYASPVKDSELHPKTPGEALLDFLNLGNPGDYIALQAFIQPTEATEKALQALRLMLRDRYKLATTLGFGPRFLHSTGQLHKGDNGSGLFVQFTTPGEDKIPIPDTPGSPGSSIDFGTLKLAQASGDRKALIDAGRRLIRFDFGVDPVEGIQHLIGAFEFSSQASKT